MAWLVQAMLVSLLGTRESSTLCDVILTFPTQGRMGQPPLEATRGLLQSLRELGVRGKFKISRPGEEEVCRCPTLWYPVLVLRRTVFGVSLVTARYYRPSLTYSILDPRIYFISLCPSIICFFIDHISQDLLTGCALRLPVKDALDF